MWDDCRVSTIVLVLVLQCCSAAVLQYYSTLSFSHLSPFYLKGEGRERAREKERERDNCCGFCSSATKKANVLFLKLLLTQTYTISSFISHRTHAPHARTRNTWLVVKAYPNRNDRIGYVLGSCKRDDHQVLPFVLCKTGVASASANTIHLCCTPFLYDCLEQSRTNGGQEGRKGSYICWNGVHWLAGIGQYIVLSL